MGKDMRYLGLTFLLLVLPFFAYARNEMIDLSGTWSFSTEKDGAGEAVTLPGTLDTNGKGAVNSNYEETTQLSRKVTYTGPAYYTRKITIPKDWKGSYITLMLERTRPTTVWVDGREAGSQDLLSTPHVYNLSDYLTPGEHIITVMVDNGERMPEEIRSSSHAATESTQTNWNGIVGRMELSSRNPLHIKDLQGYPDASDRSVRVKVELSTPDKIAGKRLVVESGNHKEIIKLSNGQAVYETVLHLGDTAQLWSEHNPYRHTVTAALPGTDTVEVKVGLRDFAQKNHQFYVNDTVAFLRGRHDACVFPLTGFAPMDVDSWRQYFRTIKEYGLNHVRFHSWCPPEACFEAADIEGIYLQPELPVWGTFDNANVKLMDFLLADGKAIHKQYSQHPSFVLFALGNELWGEVPVMRSFVETFSADEPRHLYTYGSNGYLGWQGYIPGQDFFVTCRVGGGEGYDTHTRASFSFADADEGGILNNTYPGTMRNFEDAVLLSPVPVIGHETGQFQIYPDYNEIKKYTGVLEPRNFEVFKKRLADANMLSQAHDFFRASGLWAVELYKADMEMNLRTPSMGGFQLLDLQDYPGQGTALVGILDAFMDSKGLVSPERWRESCDEIVALAEFPSYTWTGGDTFRSRFAVANYSGKSLRGDTLVAKLMVNGVPEFTVTSVLPEGNGLLQVDSVSAMLPYLAAPCKASLELSVPAQGVVNSYPIWIYPVDRSFSAEGVMLADSLGEEVRNCLASGGTVVLAPKREMVDSTTVGGLFQTDYWNYRMFKTICENAGKEVSPGTLGILTDPSHPVFSEFPTESHTNWQWYPIVKNSYPLILDRLNGIDYRPIVQVIDNVERNHRLGLLMEFKVGGGKVLVVMGDIEAMQNYPEGQQFVKSVMDYASSSAFKPATAITLEQLQELLTVPAASASITILRNISYD